jgi:hypothetical protein
MEFHIRLAQPITDLATIEDAILSVDPGAQVDIDKLGETLRVAAYVEAPELVSLLNRAGYPVDPLQVVQLPAICCGGCGG